MIGIFGIAVFVLLMVMGCCCGYLEAKGQPRIITGYELMQLIQSKIPGLHPGPCGGLLVTKNEFHVFSLEATTQLIEEIRNEITLPECRYDAASILLGRLKEENPFIAAGMMMTKGSPPWALILVAIDNTGVSRIYFFDPKQTSGIQELLVRSGIELIIF